MTVSAIVIGFGSIGQRHAAILGGMGLAVTVVSRRPVDGYPKASLPDAVAADPQAYAVIATETARHAADLRGLAEAGHRGPVLVEKPLFAQPEEMADGGPWTNTAVGYNLRFHPLVLALRQRLAGRCVIAVEAAVGQYLPNWRPGRDHRTGYSADPTKGGGVLRDLSHEIDYLLWVFGPWRRVAALTGSSGTLGVASEDHACLLAEARGGSAVTLNLDYLDRPLRRYCRVQHNEGTTTLDLGASTLSENGTVVEEADVPRDATYAALHRAVLGGGRAADPDSQLCDFTQAMQVLHMVAAVETAARERRWVET